MTVEHFKGLAELIVGGAIMIVVMLELLKIIAGESEDFWRRLCEVLHATLLIVSGTMMFSFAAHQGILG